MTFKVDVETVDSVRRRLAVEVPAETVAAEIETAYAELARAAKVPGFRPGRVPRAVLERMFGDRVRADVFAKLIQQSYSAAIEEQHIEAVGQPEIVTEQSASGASLKYSATVEVKPEVVIEQYSGLEAERPLAAVTETDVDAFMERLRQSLAQLHPITERSHAETGDVVTLDYEARVDGRLVSRAENREVEVGASKFPPQFEQRLTGASVGASLEFEVHYPADHAAAELAGKHVRFRVQVHSLARKEVPVLDDEFAKDHGECSTLDELRQRVRKRLEEDAARQADEAVTRRLVTALAQRHDIPVPSALVERRTDALVEEVLRDWAQQRIRPRNESEAIARLRKDLEPQAQEQVKIGLLLEAIARQENLTVTDDEVEARIAALAASAGSAGERVRALYQSPEAQRQLRARMLQSRAIDVVVHGARITTVDAHPSVAEVGESG